MYIHSHNKLLVDNDVVVKVDVETDDGDRHGNPRLRRLLIRLSVNKDGVIAKKLIRLKTVRLVVKQSRKYAIKGTISYYGPSRPN